MNLNKEKRIYSMTHPNSANAADFFMVDCLQDFLRKAYEENTEVTQEILAQCLDDLDTSSLISDLECGADVYFADQVADLSLVDKAIIASSSNSFEAEEDDNGVVVLAQHLITDAVGSDAASWLCNIMHRIVSDEINVNESNIMDVISETIADTQYAARSCESDTPSTPSNRGTVKQDLDTYRELRSRASDVSMVGAPVGSQYIDGRCGVGLGNIEAYAFTKFDTLMTDRYPTLKGMDQNDFDSLCDEPTNWTLNDSPGDKLPLKEFLSEARERAIELNASGDMGL